MSIGEVRLRRGEERGLIAGGRWVYDNQAAWVDEDCADGGVVDVTGADGAFLGRGFFNSRSKILVRLLSRERPEVDVALLRQRIAAAWRLRQELGFSNACRVVYGDADGLPGLTVDKFGDYLSFQITCLGMAAYQEAIVVILVELFAPKGIVERNDLAIRGLEGLPQRVGVVYGWNFGNTMPGWPPTCSMGRKPGTSWTSRRTGAGSNPTAPAEMCWTCAVTPAASPSTPPSTAPNPSRRWTSAARCCPW